MNSLCSLLLVVLPAVIPSAPDGAGDATAAKEPEPVRVLTWHGDVIVGFIDVDAVRVATKYGVLTVPIAEVRSIELAARLSEEERAAIEDEIEALRNAEEPEARQRCRQAIVDAGSLALDVLREAAANAIDGKDADELRQALGDLIETIIELEPEARTTHDTVVARRFTITGEVELDSVGMRSSYGALRLARRDVERITIGTGPGRGGSDRLLVIKTWTDVSGEYANVSEILRGTRARLDEFESTSAPDFRRRLKRCGAVLLPEFESSNEQLSVLATECSRDLVRFVREGGVVISCGGTANLQFLSASRLLSCSGSSNSSTATVVKKHAIVRGVPSTIPYANATFPIRVQSAARMTALATAQDGGIVVGLSRLGEGAVVYCGWDYYASEEPHRRVLANAVRWATRR